MSEAAQAQLEEIYLFIEAESSRQAAAWFNGLEHAIQSLATIPLRCPVVSARPDLRHLLYGNKPHIYRVIIRVTSNAKTVDVLAIRHGARAPKNPLL